MRKWIALLALAAMLGCVLAPHPGFTEDRDTVQLARCIYALARNESYETKLAIGTVVMNRMDNPWYADTLGGVLSAQHQFPAGNRYDAESLSAAHDVLCGRRVLPASAIGYQSVNATERRADPPIKTVGGYCFYAEEANTL